MKIYNKRKQKLRNLVALWEKLCWVLTWKQEILVDSSWSWSWFREIKTFGIINSKSVRTEVVGNFSSQINKHNDNHHLSPQSQNHQRDPSHRHISDSVNRLKWTASGPEPEQWGILTRDLNLPTHIICCHQFSCKKCLRVSVNAPPSQQEATNSRHSWSETRGPLKSCHKFKLSVRKLKKEPVRANSQRPEEQKSCGLWRHDEC